MDYVQRLHVFRPSSEKERNARKEKDEREKEKEKERDTKRYTHTHTYILLVRLRGETPRVSLYRDVDHMDRSRAISNDGAFTP